MATRTIFGFSSISVVLLIAAAPASASPYTDAVLANNPLAYFQFNETSGTVADNTGSLMAAADGTFGTGVTPNQASYDANLGTAYAFSGGAVRVPDNAAFDVGTGPFSVEMWFNTNNDARGDLFTYKGGGGDFGIQSNSQGDPAGFDASVTAYFNAPNGTAGADKGLWHHVVVTRGAASIFNLYIDGALASSGTDGDSWNIANDILIGSNHSGNPSNIAIAFDGLIDEVAIYDTALSANDVANHFAAATAIVPEPASIAIWSLLGLAGLGYAVRPQRIRCA